MSEILNKEIAGRRECSAKSDARVIEIRDMCCTDDRFGSTSLAAAIHCEVLETTEDTSVACVVDTQSWIADFDANYDKGCLLSDSTVCCLERTDLTFDADEVDCYEVECLTPKASELRIPKDADLVCPCAPRKPRAESVVFFPVSRSSHPPGVPSEILEAFFDTIENIGSFRG
ncbi:hypothetical protein KP509_18G012400 [Ceratopteris richardii]|uniref:Uncharacterized protein n=1 Tax=Ceratopteris richardii TaxID=49495 RepID=A0A8T2SQW5_CERRI|nr:hypothetical protein KP509_18G012400 [Ceratopteris richardii]